MSNSEHRALAVETDTKLAELDGFYAQLESRMARTINELHSIAGDRQDVIRTGRTIVRSWQRTLASVLTACQTGAVESWNATVAAEVAASYADVHAKIQANRTEADKLEQVWADNGRWSRFFLVLNNNGHLHSDMSNYRCSRTPTTTHGWNPELSGATEAEAVAQMGPLLCTVCFPSAPVEWTVGKPKAAKCAGSGQYVRYTGPARMTTYVECPECHTSQARTSLGYVRAHKPAS